MFIFLCKVKTFFESQKLRSLGYGSWNKWSETKDKFNFSFSRFLMQIEIKTQECPVSWHSALFFLRTKNSAWWYELQFWRWRIPSRLYGTWRNWMKWVKIYFKRLDFRAGLTVWYTKAGKQVMTKQHRHEKNRKKAWKHLTLGFNFSVRQFKIEWWGAFALWGSPLELDECRYLAWISYWGKTETWSFCFIFLMLAATM